MNPFIRHCNQFSELSEEAKEALLRKLSSKTYVKKELIVAAGKHCTRLYFIQSGLVKLCHTKESGVVIFKFFAENSVFTILDSFLLQTSSKYYIEAIENSFIWSISSQDLEELCKEYHCVERCYRRIIALASVNLMKRFDDMMNRSASQRYDFFLQEHEEYSNKVSLGDIAAYIGVTQVSLSRIRGKK